MDTLVSPFQSAFVANRQIHDNIVITHEILHSFKRKKKNSKNGHLAIKLDLSKAFDRLEWSFILAVFKKLGFSEEWCQMIQQFISTVSYSVLVNGSPGETFHPSRGIRQGDCPPYIFILCMEVLSQLLLKADEDKLIQGFKFKKNSPSISHLFFVDDCMLFVKASVTYAKNLLKIINVFANASGQAINFEKSGFITSGKMHHKHINFLSKTLKMKFLSNSEKYLGTPLFIGKDKTTSFNFLIENLYSRLGSSKKSNLNVAGRTVVTKHVLCSMSVYHMACFPLPKTVTFKIDSIRRAFWWSKKNSKRAAYFRSWGDIGKSKLNGGLGIMNTYATNRVFICKLGWRILNNLNILLSSFTKDKYFPNQNLLEIDKAANSSSWIRKGIVNGLHFIKSNSVVKINNGVSSRIWYSNWIPEKLNPPVPRHPSHINYVFVSELFDIQNGCWNVSLLSTLFLPEDITRIRSIRINPNMSDKFMWSHTRNVARHIWFGVSLLHLISPDLDWIDDYFLYWHNSDLGEFPFNVSWPSIGTITMWCIWKLRCDVIFRNASIDLNKVILDTKRMFNTYISPRISPADVSNDIKIPIAEVDHFMFVNGSFKDFDMGLGVIWFDVAGNVRSSRSDYGLIPNAVGAEAAALILAISWEEEMNLSRVVFVSDCLQLVHFINGVNSNIAWRSSDLPDQCRSLISSSVSFKIMYIKHV
ncbi:uncharacterized protein LOC113295701 [Papaver somniferum]|uniref:uncharacterized protein LOC113295701 n=1 Tax=Papaver somniferum TaxID=3469 RepID=UPI000E6F7A0A|nr:uncharacterized protein LOC113295701 [Papaver somniferum]